VDESCRIDGAAGVCGDLGIGVTAFPILRALAMLIITVKSQKRIVDRPSNLEIPFSSAIQVSDHFFAISWLGTYRAPPAASTGSAGQPVGEHRLITSARHNANSSMVPASVSDP
jgi:hypothetical protein